MGEGGGEKHMDSSIGCNEPAYYLMPAAGHLTTDNCLPGSCYTRAQILRLRAEGASFRPAVFAPVPAAQLYSLLTTYRILPTPRYSILAVVSHYLPLDTHVTPHSSLSSLLTTKYSLTTPHSSLLTTHYSLLTTHH